MLSLDGCGIAKQCITLPRPKPVPKRNEGFCTKFVCQSAHISGSLLRMANLSVYLIGYKIIKVKKGGLGAKYSAERDEF